MTEEAQEVIEWLDTVEGQAWHMTTYSQINTWLLSNVEGEILYTEGFFSFKSDGGEVRCHITPPMNWTPGEDPVAAHP